MPKATFVSTEGPYLKAIIEIGGQAFCVFDEFSVDEPSMPLPGTEFEYEFSNYLDEDDETWEDIFSSNPEQRIGIEQIEGWKYRAYGKVIGINPVRIDCGLFIEEDVIDTHDPRVIGEYVAFTITRLGGHGYAI
jgi:hypothetical protein